MMNIPLLRIPFEEPDIRFLSSGLSEILSSGSLTMGPYTSRFEEMFAAFSGARFAVSCSNGTSALELILRGLGVEGQSVIVPTNTFLATALAVLHSGNRVIFADSEPETLCLDVADVKRRLTGQTAAVILVHIGGIVTPAVYELQRLCREKGIHLIEDCAHAHGCSLDGRGAGALGTAGAFSFFPTKVLTTGEGGMVTTDDEALARRIRVIRNHGKDPALGNRSSQLGHNYRLSEITALLGVQQMQKAPSIVDERRRIAAFYDSRLPGLPRLRPVALAPGAVSTYYKYIIYLDPGVDRGEVKKTLQERHGISLTGEVYAELCHTQPVWERLTYCGRRRAQQPEEGNCGHPGPCGNAENGFPGAEYISRHHICLPSYPGLSEMELEHIVTSLEKVLSEAKEA
ncbi:MAG: DegT/DnrJ/EryC1/StrS family aminotransferase [Acidobacteria bacterium]|nr:DegT/DnrJ/EryC1/StrS family aminotransferase [Acidobacteriota bacterium]